MRSVNGETPVPLEKAREKYIEEMADVLVMLDIAMIEVNAYEHEVLCKTIDFKRARMAERLVGMK